MLLRLLAISRYLAWFSASLQHRKALCEPVEESESVLTGYQPQAQHTNQQAKT